MPAPLQRRLFVWFGATTLITTLVVALSAMVLGQLVKSPWQKDMENVHALIADRALSVWDQPAARDELMRSVATKLELRIELLDAAGKTLAVQGAECARGCWRMKIPIEQAERTLGQVSICGQRRLGYAGKMFFSLALIIAVFWAASRVFARRISSPMAEVAQVAQAIGRGRLEARAAPEPSSPSEVHILAESINEMAERIEKQLHDQRVLLAAVSHELRTPLGHLRILAEIAKDAPEKPALFKKTADDIEREVLEIDALVGELLARSRLDFDSICPQEIDTCEMAQRALERAGLDIGLAKCEGAVPMLAADPTLIARALANLVNNAERHGGGLVGLEVSVEDDRFLFAVDDAGPGVPEGDEKRIFEPFYRSGEKKERSLGLGLSLVRRIAEAHGGSVSVQARPEGGARFVLALRKIA